MKREVLDADSELRMLQEIHEIKKQSEKRSMASCSVKLTPSESDSAEMSQSLEKVLSLRGHGCF